MIPRITLKQLIFLAGAACESLSLLFVVVSVIPFDSSEKLKFMFSNPLMLDVD